MIDRRALDVYLAREATRLRRAAAARAPGHGHFDRGRRRDRAPCGRRHGPRARCACWPPAAATPCTGALGLGCPARTCTPPSASCPAARPGEVELHFGRGCRAGRVRLGGAGLAGRPALTCASGVMAERDAPDLLRAHARAHLGAAGHACPERRPAAPEDPAPGEPGPHLSRPADCSRRRGRPGQADDRRRHLLRAAERRDRRRGGRARPGRERADARGTWPSISGCGSAA